MLVSRRRAKSAAKSSQGQCLSCLLLKFRVSTPSRGAALVHDNCTHANKTTTHVYSSLNTLISFRHFCVVNWLLVLSCKDGKEENEIGAFVGTPEGTPPWPCILALFQTFKSHQEKRNRLCYTPVPSVYVHVPI